MRKPLSVRAVLALLLLAPLARSEAMPRVLSKEEEKALSEHVRYIKQLLAEGRLVMAEPAFDPPQYPEGNALALELPTPGLVVFEAEGDEEALRILEADPAVKAGVFKGRVNPFKLSFWRE